VSYDNWKCTPPSEELELEVCGHVIGSCTCGDVLAFPSGQRIDVSALPALSSGRTTLADGSEGALYAPELREVPAAPAGMLRLTTPRLIQLAMDLGELADTERESEAGEPWFEWCANAERQALGELARRSI